MSSIYSIDGVLVTRDNFDNLTAATPVTLEIVMPSGQSTFSYSIIEQLPFDLPWVDININANSVRFTGPGIPQNFDFAGDDSESYLGRVSTNQGNNFVALTIDNQIPGGEVSGIFFIGGNVPSIPTDLAQAQALENSITGLGAATGSLGPNRSIDLNSLANTTVQSGPNLIAGTDGNDFLVGTPQDDLITTGDNTAGDIVVASGGNDTIDMSDITADPGGFVEIDYSGLAAGNPISAVINGITNVGTVGKGALGTDTLVDVEKPMIAGWTSGGFSILGTPGNDSFEVTVASQQWASIQPGDGVDDIVIHGNGLVRLDMRGGNGIDVNLEDRNIADDGFGNQELIRGSGRVWEVYGSEGNDVFVGSIFDESYRYAGGNNTLDGGGGFNRLRYDDASVQSVSINVDNGQTMGVLSGGGTFTDTFTGFGRFIGSAGDDLIVGGIGNTDGTLRLEGRGGDDRIFGDSALAVYYGLDLANQVYRVYQATLDREPDVRGHHRWTSELFTGESTLQEVADGFVRAPEFRATYSDDLSDGDFVTLLYNNVLGRAAPDAQGFARWTGELADGATRAEVVLGFSQSPQFINDTNAAASAYARNSATSTWSDDVFRLYQATLDREPDVQGQNRWTGELASGESTLVEVADGFVRSPQFRATYSDDLSDGDFVTLLYNNVLGRAPDAQGFARWTGELADGATRAEVVLGFSQSPQFRADTAENLKDWMRAQGTDDMILAGSGDNLVAGGQYADNFMFFSSVNGRTTVADLEPWDFISLNGFGYGTVAQARANMSQQGNNVVFSDQGVEVVFRGTTLADITDDMIFV